MIFFRKFLIWIKKERNKNAKKLYLLSFLASLLGVLIGTALDLFVPFNSWGNVSRTAVLLPTMVSMFIFGYAISIHLHNKRISEDPLWQPYRARLSPSWRRRAALVVGAFILLAVYANGQSIGYTPISSLLAAVVIGLIAFIRTTTEEAQREELNIPDSRDIRYEQQVKKLEQARAEAQRKKAERKKKQSEKDSENNE